jgi:hypothetical protein
LIDDTPDGVRIQRLLGKLDRPEAIALVSSFGWQ